MDGTKIPVSILRPRGIALDRSNPTLLYGYGGYGLSIEPTFDPVLLASLEQGAFSAVARMRAAAGTATIASRGQPDPEADGADDFMASAEHVIDSATRRREPLRPSWARVRAAAP